MSDNALMRLNLFRELRGERFLNIVGFLVEYMKIVDILLGFIFGRL